MDKYKLRTELERDFYEGNRYIFQKKLSPEDLDTVVEILWENMLDSDTFILKKEIQELKSRIKTLDSKSGQRVRCLQVLKDRRALVQLGPLREEVMISPSVDITNLVPGTEVLLIGSAEGRLISAVREASIYDGRLAKVQRVVDSRRAIIDEGGSSVVLNTASWIDCKEGDEIRYDPDARMIVEIISNKEKSDYLLSELPKETFDDVKGLKEEKQFLYERIIYPSIYREKFSKYGIQPIKGAILHGKPGNGKAQPLDSDVLTPNGFIKMKDVKVGTIVSTPDGGSAKISGVFPQGEIDIYKVIFSDGTSTECSLDHLWNVKSSRDRSQKNNFKTITLKEISEKIIISGGKRNYSIPMVKPINFSENNLPIDPYILGVILGDGMISTKTIGVSNIDDYILNKVDDYLKSDFNCKLVKRGYAYYGIINNNKRKINCFIKSFDLITGNEIIYNNILDLENKGLNVGSIYGVHNGICKSYKKCKWSIIRRPSYPTDVLFNHLKELNLFGKRSWEKHVPEIYLFSSIENRIKLLQGLMDTDGTVYKNGYEIEFGSTSKKLSYSVKFLVESLGGKATINSRFTKFSYLGEIKTGRKSFRVNISLPPEIIPFQVPRKKEKYIPRSKYLPLRYISKIEFVGKKEAQCILIDHPDNLYITNNFIVTHNTMIASAIYNEMAKIKNSKTSTGFFIINGPSVLSKWAGQTEATIRKIFKEARDIAKISGFPSIIFWDEIESITGKRKDTSTYTPEKTVVPTLLAELQGVEKDNDVILIGASNRPDLIDPALMRPGRLGDIILEIPPPEREAAVEIFNAKFTKDVPISLKQAVEQGLVEKLVSHIYDSEKPLAVAKTDGKDIFITRQELVSGAFLANMRDEIIRKACLAEIAEKEFTVDNSIIDNIFFAQLGVLDSGVKNGFEFNLADHIIDVSLM